MGGWLNVLWCYTSGDRLIYIVVSYLSQRLHVCICLVGV